MSEVARRVEICLTGFYGVGKSSLMRRFAEETFDEASTLVVDYQIKDVIHDGKTVRVKVLDTAGQEKFKQITTQMYLHAQGLMVVFDIANADSFNCREYFDEIERYAQPEADVILVGNKSDLWASRTVSEGEIQAFIKSLKTNRQIQYFEVSAKTGDGVDKVFKSLVEKMCTRLLKEKPTAQENAKKNDGCCQIL